MRRLRAQCGFSLVEALVAAAIFVATSVVLFHFVGASQRIASAQPDGADVNQRLRVAAAAIARDLHRAGAGDLHGRLGTLASYLPPIVPARTGAAGADPELSAFDDRITIVYVPDDGSSVRLVSDMATPADDVPVQSSGVGCSGAGLCGFVAGTRAAILDAAAPGLGYELFTAIGNGGALAHGPPDPPFSKAYSASSAVVVPIVQRVYFFDRAGRRIVRYDGYKSTQPLVDNVTALQFTYLLDPHPASVPAPADTSGNCLYAAGSPPISLLAALGPGTLVPVALAAFTDGPFCGIPPRRFDADLLRIRAVRVRIRVQAAPDRSRGAGSDYANPGTSSSDLSSVRDLEVSIDITPRNLRAAR